MERDEEFSQFAGVAWSTLVRSAVLWGCSLHDAEDPVQATLLRCFVSWGKVMSASDRDAYPYRILVNCQRDSRPLSFTTRQPMT